MTWNVAPTMEDRDKDLIPGIQRKWEPDENNRGYWGKGKVLIQVPEQTVKFGINFYSGRWGLEILASWKQVMMGPLLFKGPGRSVLTPTSFLLCLSHQTTSEKY